jgi:hypothetical protein
VSISSSSSWGVAALSSTGATPLILSIPPHKRPDQQHLRCTVHHPNRRPFTEQSTPTPREPTNQRPQAAPPLHPTLHSPTRGTHTTEPHRPHHHRKSALTGRTTPSDERDSRYARTGFSVFTQYASPNWASAQGTVRPPTGELQRRPSPNDPHTKLEYPPTDHTPPYTAAARPPASESAAPGIRLPGLFTGPGADVFKHQPATPGRLCLAIHCANSDARVIVHPTIERKGWLGWVRVRLGESSLAGSYS